MKTSVKFLTIWLLSVMLLAWCSTSNISNEIRNEEALSTESSKPDRKMEIYGKVKSMIWNIIVISKVDTTKDPTFNMDSVEKRKYMQSLDQSERMALKEEIQKAILWDIKITIPVWIPMTKKIAQWPTGVEVEWSLSDIKVNWYLSIWLDKEITDKKIAEFVKISYIRLL